VLRDGCDHSLAFGNQIDDARINLIQTLAQLQQFRRR
jgi:hypothetical protein